MRYKYILDNIIDTEKNKPDIEQTVQEIVRVLTEIYKEYDAEITFVKYDSTAIGTQSSDIFFVIDQKKQGFYPLFSLSIPFHFSRSLAPVTLAQRKFMGQFAIDGVSKEMRNTAKNEYGMDTMIRVMNSGAPTTVEEKIKELFKMAEPNIEQWKSFVLMHDIFIF